MAELISGPLPDSLAEQALGSQAFQTTPGEVLGAEATDAFQHLPTVGLLRQQQRYNESGIDPAAQAAWAGYTDPRNPGSDVDAMAAERGEAPQRNITHQDTLNEQAKQAGAEGLKFDRPIDQSTATSIIEDHVAAQKRASIIQRNGSAILSGQVARIATDMLVGLADPLNLGAMLIPAAPEAFVAEKLAAAAGAFERTAIRGAAGAANGAVGMAALEPLNYAMSKADYNDWSAGDALRNIAFGAALGGAGHAILGGIFGRVARLEPEDRAAALQAALGQTLEGRPVDIASLLDHAEATRAADNLDKWHAEQERIFSDTEELRRTTQVEPAPDNSGVIAEHEATLSSMRESAAQMRGEIEDVKRQAIVSAMDPETRARLDEVQHELTGVIPKARRAALEQERAMLLEGRGEFDANAQPALEQGRTEAQVQGLSVAADRLEKQAVETEAKLAELRQADEAAQVEAQARRNSADRTQRIEQAKIDSREAVLQSLMEREMRVYAARVGVTLDPGEAAALARDIRTAQPREVEDTIANALNSLAKRSGKADVLASVDRQPIASGSGVLRQEAQGAARDMAERAMSDKPDPRVEAARKSNVETVKTAPKVEADLDKQVAEAEALHQDAARQVQGEIAAGRMQETAELKAAIDAADDIQKTGKASADYASCLVARGL